MEIIEEALKKGQKTLSEYDSKRMLSSYGFPVVREKLVGSRAGAVKAAKEIGFPVVLKACSPEVAHKTEKKLIEVDLRSLKEVERAYEAIVERAGETSLDGLLVQEMVKGSRELVIGMYSYFPTGLHGDQQAYAEVEIGLDGQSFASWSLDENFTLNYN